MQLLLQWRIGAANDTSIVEKPMDPMSMICGRRRARTEELRSRACKHAHIDERTQTCDTRNTSSTCTQTCAAERLRASSERIRVPFGWLTD